MESPTPEKLTAWRAKVPKVACDCVSFLDLYFAKREHQPRFDDWFRWTFELRNAVRVQKLGLPAWDWGAAMKQWRPHLAWGKQAPLAGLVAVTSLSPNRLERQLICLDSWRKFGLEIIAVNSPSEIESMRYSYPVSEWVPAEFAKTPKINSLLDVSTQLDTPLLLINSDIEIYGDQSRLIDLVRARKPAIGIRHNYDSQPGDSTLERWGLDAYLLYPEQVERLPQVDWAIGKPMWDYWLAWELDRLGYSPEWIGDPYFFHKSHPIAWSQAECTEAHTNFNAQFGQMDWVAWRKQQPFWVPE